MAFEDLKAAANSLMNEIMKNPEDSHVLQEQLREKISEMRTLGLAVPAELVQFEDALSKEDSDDDDFDNLPV